MTPNEAAKLLAVAAAFDNRKPDADSATAWAAALDGHRFEDCRDAIVQHYRTSREWIMPADVITAVKKTRTSRLEDVAPTPPAGMDPDDTGSYARWLEVTRRAIADGQDVPTEDYGPTRRIGELRHVLRAVPAIEAKPREKSPEHEDRLAKARAELESHPARREPAPQPEPADDEGGAA
jgi:hypothetical protein